LGVEYNHDSLNVLNLAEAFSRQEEFDIIHTHIDNYDHIFRSHSKVPTLATLHNIFWPSQGAEKNGLWYDGNSRVSLYNKYPELPYISISNKYRDLCPAKINFIETIYHGLNQDNFTFRPNPEDCFVWLGRITRVKGLDIAVKLAKEIGFNLLIAGAVVSSEEKIFFDKEIKPYLNDKIQFVGELKSDQEKSDFLGKGKALLYPLVWEEPFGIVMAEAMACGTPVIAYDRGSASEIIKNGKTGYLVKDLEEMTKAVKDIDQIDRNECRKWVEEKFTIEKMVDTYEKVYYQLIEDKTEGLN
jgi:glycosyltransferase involved in cell wall biosynthesis